MKKLWVASGEHILQLCARSLVSQQHFQVRTDAIFPLSTSFVFDETLISNLEEEPGVSPEPARIVPWFRKRTAHLALVY